MKTLTPAHGRDYKSCKEAKAAYMADKDFILNDVTSRWDGKPISGNQIPGEQVKLTFAKGRKSCMASYKKTNEGTMIIKTDVKKALSEKAEAAIQDMMQSEAVGRIVRKFHAAGTATKHKRGVTASQKAKNSGVASASKRRKSAIKTMKSKKKKTGAIVSKKTLRKIARAKAKRPGA